MKTRLIFLVVILISVVGVFLFSATAGAAIPTGEVACSSSWEADASRQNCTLRKFCTNDSPRISEGARHFNTQAECQNYLSEHFQPVDQQVKPSVNVSDVSISWPKRIILQVQEFFLNILVRFFPSLQSGSGGLPIKEVTTSDFTLTSQDQGQTIEVPLGKTIRVIPFKLDLKWQINYDPNILQLLTQTSKVPSPGPDGWLFKTIKIGSRSMMTFVGESFSEMAPPRIDYYISVTNSTTKGKNEEIPTKEQSVYNCGGFMGTQCPSGYKCKILGGDAGTCVKQ